MQLFSFYIMITGYVIAGILHFVFPKAYKRIMPPWIPFHYMMIYFSGVCEIVFALLLIPEMTRTIGAWFLIAMLVAIFPANIQMMTDFRKRKSNYFWLTLLRLPLQPVLIWWAWSYVK
ncbi:MAG: DoxX family protein [Bacteroidetes bacterium]|nr:DoxX family protein [Bacteroidota bacterium]